MKTTYLLGSIALAGLSTYLVKYFRSKSQKAVEHVKHGHHVTDVFSRAKPLKSPIK